MPKSQSQSAAANAGVMPESTHATRALDQSEQEYNRMISQQMTYHKTMMDDLMKLSSESGSGSDANNINIVSGLGTTVSNMNATNEQLVNAVSNYANQGNQSSQTASKLNAYTQKTASKLNDDIQAYNSLVNQNQEGFKNANPTMDAALEISEMMNESQKYALVLFGSLALVLLYKTVKHL
jgi:hypothetical protein